MPLFPSLIHPSSCEVRHAENPAYCDGIGLGTLCCAQHRYAHRATWLGCDQRIGPDRSEGVGMAMVMVGDEVTAIVTMAGAVAGRWGGEVTTVRQVTGKTAGANPILARKAKP